ncbi:hypothetical protein PHLCEN_2v2164 [Hermanssonia centrifuga]|uniref:Decapping nuclease n=1 Tax=Hermanssonia centrifuga TaxID=98765 RepID=A0A2R6RPW1_9APHY|nr:hypothetical protein PHLCEN_2v2164 [Hermanssonia centrifuga]
MSLKRNISELSDEALSPTRQTKRRIEKTEPDARKLRYPSKDKQTSAVPFQQPSQLLTFSYSASRELEFTNSALRSYVDPPIGADLRYGYDRWVKRPEERGRLDGLLKAISRYRSEMDESGGSGTSWLKSIAVVSWRGVMTK